MLPGAIVRVAFVARAAAACHQSSVTTPPRPTSRSAGQRDEITRKDFEPLLSQPDASARDRRRSPTHRRVRSASAHPSLDPLTDARRILPRGSAAILRDKAEVPMPEIQHSRRISLTLALARRHQELTVLRVVHVEQHRRAQHRLRLGTLTAFEQRRA